MTPRKRTIRTRIPNANVPAVRRHVRISERQEDGRRPQHHRLPLQRPCRTRTRSRGSSGLGGRQRHHLSKILTRAKLPWKRLLPRQLQSQTAQVKETTRISDIPRQLVNLNLHALICLCRFELRSYKLSMQLRRLRIRGLMLSSTMKMAYAEFTTVLYTGTHGARSIPVAPCQANRQLSPFQSAPCILCTIHITMASTKLVYPRTVHSLGTFHPRCRQVIRLLPYRPVFHHLRLAWCILHRYPCLCLCPCTYKAGLMVTHTQKRERGQLGPARRQGHRQPKKLRRLRKPHPQRRGNQATSQFLV